MTTDTKEMMQAIAGGLDHLLNGDGAAKKIETYQTLHTRPPWAGHYRDLVTSQLMVVA